MFYIVSLIKSNPTMSFAVGCLLIVSSFNTVDAYKGGRLYAASFSAFNSDLIESYGNSSVGRKVAVRSELAYDVPENGRGGPEADVSADEASYPTTADDALIADFAPLTIDQNQASRDQIVYYTVQDGDTISEVADQFGLSPDTLLWANNMSSVNYIKAGQRLEILPTDGVKYTVKKGDTINSLAQKYKADPEEIIAYNNLPADGHLSADDVLIVPGGHPYVAPAPPIPKVKKYAQKMPAISSAASNKYFIFPTTGRISQGLHGHNGVDIANQCGTPVYAAADGYIMDEKTTTSRARTGASVYSGYGNHIKIMHPNGVVTLYGHLKEILLPKGEAVKQGDMIAYMGGGFERVNGKIVRMEGAGRSTGCHLHFEVRGAKNFVVSR